MAQEDGEKSEADANKDKSALEFFIDAMVGNT